MPSFQILHQFFYFFAQIIYIIFFLLFCYSIGMGMIENVTDDGVQSKPTIIETSGDVKPTVNVKLKVKIPFQTHIKEKSKLVPTSVAKLRDYEV